MHSVWYTHADTMKEHEMWMMDAAETSHKHGNLHMHDNTQAGVITVLCFLVTALASSLCLSSCLWFFSRPKTVLSSA